MCRAAVRVGMPRSDRFGPAGPDEDVVHGAAAPGFGRLDPTAAVDDWIASVRQRGVERVCCLLSERQLERYGDLLGQYRRAFGREAVLHAPVADHHLADRTTLVEEILPFLRDADRRGEPVVVHCLAGLGRTGHVLAAWLASERGYDPEAALEAVEATGRRPREAVEAGNAAEAHLLALLESLA